MAGFAVTNDLQSPIEMKLQSEDWKVVYPQKSCDVCVSDGEVSFVEVRLRESPEVKGSYQATGGTKLWASLDFESFSREAKRRDRGEARQLAREGERREEAQKQKDAAIQQIGWSTVLVFGVIPLLVLFCCTIIPAESAIAAALLAIATVPFCCSLTLFVVAVGSEHSRCVDFGECRFPIPIAWRLVGLIGLALLAWMTAQHTERGFGWTAAIVWPVPLLWGGRLLLRLVLASRSDREVERRNEAKREINSRNIHFDGSVIRERGRPCVASWPGKCEGAWESLVSQTRRGEVSAAVVFLPWGIDDYGAHDSIPLAEGLPGRCWCTPLYGEEQLWGCRWFTQWRQNIETAVESGAELEVYYLPNRVGKGKVKSFDTAGDENLQREELNSRQKGFEQSPEFKQALDAGLGNLSREPRGDGSSQYSREARRLFLASLSKTEREFLATSEGLGNSQRAEVAWLERKGYAYWEVDVSRWLPGDGDEQYVPASAEQRLQLRSQQELSMVPLMDQVN
ncbi:unnamed protein product [Symbiodinium sp. CCMP2592]|nr:unnamed protein product [Symbiodinium sp. CCMP2592]